MATMSFPRTLEPSGVGCKLQLIFYIQRQHAWFAAHRRQNELEYRYRIPIIIYLSSYQGIQRMLSTERRIKNEAPDRAWMVFLVFLRLGLTSFGGPVAHLGLLPR